MVKGNALLGRSVREHIEHDRRAAQMSHPMLRDQAEDHRWLDLAQADLGAANRNDRPRICPAAAMEHWQRPQINAVEPKTNAQAVPKCRKVSPSVTIYDAFWVACRAGGVQQAKRLPLIGNAVPAKARIGGGQERLIISGSDWCAWSSRNIDMAASGMWLEYPEWRNLRHREAIRLRGEVNWLIG